MRTLRLFPLLLLLFIGLGLILSAGDAPAFAQGQNLLTNPGFEGQYSSYIPETPLENADCPVGVCTTAQTPQGWKPWWVKERPTDVNPEFKPAEHNVGGNRVRSGNRAAQYFSFWSTHKAGLRQTVSVPANAVVEFSVWGHSWMSESDTSLVSDRSGTPNMRIGIDPTGSGNVYSPSIVWSEYKQAFDTFALFSVQAQAQGDRVTVFVFSAPSVNPNSPDYGFKHTDVYWDDASLVVVGAGSAPAPVAPSGSAGGGGESSAPAPAPVSVSSVVQPTATPNAEGIIYAEVGPGDSIWSVAAKAGLTLQEILELNDMTQDSLIRVGDLIIIGKGDPPSAEEPTPEGQAEEAPSAEATATPEPAPTEDQQSEEPAPVPESSGGSSEIAVVEEAASGASVCLKAYVDHNQNARQDAGEPLRPAVAFTISDGQSVVSNYVSDGQSEPFCIKGLDAGIYRVTRSSLPNEVLTTAGDHSIALSNGSSLSLEFGSYDTDSVQAAAGEGDSTQGGNSDQSGEGSSGDPLSGLAIGAVILAILLLVGVVVIILGARRSTGEAK